jgi:hypothetical protein
MYRSILFSLVVSFIASTRLIYALALVTPAPPLPTTLLDQRRDAGSGSSTCGFLNGDPSKPWIAPKGFNCRVDTLNGIWGFCPVTVVAETDCGFGAYCFDNGPCSTGCGRASLRNNPRVTTWTW